jgi:nitrate/nitrite transporter NarK
VIADLLLQLQRTGFKRTLGVFALACLSPVLIAVFTPLDTAATAGDFHVSVLAKPSLWLIGAVFMLYAPLEGWLSSAAPYLKRSGFTERGAAVLLAITWMVFLTARFAIAYWQQAEVLNPDSDHILMLILALIATVALGNLAGSHRVDSISFWVLLLGVALGPIFSSLVGFLLLYFQPHEHGTAYGTMFAIGTAGSLLLGPLITPRAGKPDADRFVFRLLALVSLGLIAVILAAWVTR